jgi:hypothetical protein
MPYNLYARNDTNLHALHFRLKVNSDGRAIISAQNQDTQFLLDAGNKDHQLSSTIY